MEDQFPVFNTITRQFQNSNLVYRESFWSRNNWNPPDINQVAGTCLYHAFTLVLEFHFWILYYLTYRVLPPFDRLSAQYLYDKVKDTIEDLLEQNPFNEPMADNVAISVIETKGIKDTQDYTLPRGLRGENNWQFSGQQNNASFYRAPMYTALDMQSRIMARRTATAKFNMLENALQNGPVYISFYPPEDYNDVGDKPHIAVIPDERADTDDLHAVMAVGTGSYVNEEGVEIVYIKYFNTWGSEWGDGGYGRLIAGNMDHLVNVWFPTELDVVVGPEI